MANLSNINNKFLVTTGGNVGINTTSPGSKLDVRGSGYFLGTASSGAALVTIENNSGSTATSYGLLVLGGGNSSNGRTFEVRDASGNTDLIVKGDGNVGIGTAAPDSPLEIEFAENTGTIKQMLHLDYNPVNNYGSALFKISAGTNSAAVTQIEQVTSGGNGSFGTYQDTNIINRGVGGISAGNINFITGSNTSASSIVMTIGGGSQKGNVGIGTATPENKLHILRSSSDTQSQLMVQNGSTGDAAIKFNVSGQSYVMGIDYDDSKKFKIASSSNLGTTDRITLLSSGNVGIGTISPSKKLEVAGSYKLGTNGYIQYDASYPYTITTANTASVGNLVFSAGLGSAPYESKIELQGSNTAGAAGITLSTASTPRITVTADGKIGLRKTDPYYDVDATELGANSYAWGSGLAIFGQDRYNIRELNNLFYSANTRCAGIGSSSNLQSDMFDGNFDSAYAIGANTTYVVEIDGTGVMNMTYPQGYAVISFYYIYNNYTSLTGEQYHYSGTYSGQWRAMGAATNIRGSAGSGGRVVRLNSAGNNYVNKWRFTFVTGSTGINVADIAFFTSRDAGAQVNTYMRGDRTSEWTRTIRFRNDANTVVGSIAPGSTSTAFNTSSDYRLKEDLKDFAGLNMISKIPVYSFKWINKDKRSHGVLAHELEKVLPQAVTGEKDAKKTQVVDYSKIVPLLIKAIQELKAEIDELKK